MKKIYCKHHLPDKKSDKHFSHGHRNTQLYDSYRKVKEEKDRLYRYCDYLHRSAIESLATGFKAISIDVIRDPADIVRNAKKN